MTNEEKLKRRVDELTLLANKFHKTLDDVLYFEIMPELTSAHVNGDAFNLSVASHSRKILLVSKSDANYHIEHFSLSRIPENLFSTGSGGGAQLPRHGAWQSEAIVLSNQFLTLAVVFETTQHMKKHRATGRPPGRI